MSPWAQQLTDVSRAGSYTLVCDVDALRASAAEAGVMVFEVDLKGIKGKQKFIAALAAAVVVPPDFGENWDALADALCDLSWCGKAGGYALLLRNVNATLGLSAHDREIALDILADTTLYWRQRKVPFWVFYD
ncbi:MAG: barstar family protein [Gallionella sp.]|jgi:hypothetical protein|nr:barstar family protein [Gallionella sp.]